MRQRLVGRGTDWVSLFLRQVATECRGGEKRMLEIRLKCSFMLHFCRIVIVCFQCLSARHCYIAPSVESL